MFSCSQDADACVRPPNRKAGCDTRHMWHAWERNRCHQNSPGEGTALRCRPSSLLLEEQPFCGRWGPTGRGSELSAAPAPGDIKLEFQRNDATAEVWAERPVRSPFVLRVTSWAVVPGASGWCRRWATRHRPRVRRGW